MQVMGLNWDGEGNKQNSLSVRRENHLTEEEQAVHEAALMSGLINQCLEENWRPERSLRQQSKADSEVALRLVMKELLEQDFIIACQKGSQKSACQSG